MPPAQALKSVGLVYHIFTSLVHLCLQLERWENAVSHPWMSRGMKPLSAMQALTGSLFIPM